MVALFADLPEAVENTVEIARRCAVRPRKRKPILPRFADDEVEELRRQARAGLAARLAVIPRSAPEDVYRERLEFELGVIEGMGFPGYFLIVADFIKWAKERDIPVGPGRGSGAGSLVAYALTITDLDPLRYGLLFERFLNPERISMPDFDIDFCMDRREEVIAYVQERYGRDRVAQIITFGALLSKAAVRDVGRVLQMPYGQVDRLSKLIPLEGVKPVSIEKALADEPRLREEARREPQVARLLEIAGTDRGPAAQRLDPRRRRRHRRPPARRARAALPRPALGHAGDPVQHEVGRGSRPGEVRLPRPEDPDGHPERPRPPEGPRRDHRHRRHPPRRRPQTYELYACAADRRRLPGGIHRHAHRAPPAQADLHRGHHRAGRALPPRPDGEHPEVLQRQERPRAARARCTPRSTPILDETQGIIVYQEQVMEIARKLAGYSLGGADLLRRAMGKKIQAEMDAQKPLFLEGAAENGVSKAKAEEVWNLLDKFANYGFNKSHAAAYAVVSYQTAWLKANHPVEFMAAVMNCDIHLTDKLGPYKQEVDRLGIAVVPPCVNRSDATFTVAEGRIVYALGALKNVGVDAMRLIVEARRAGGAFDGLFDFAARVDLRRVGKRALEMLARAGALDALEFQPPQGLRGPRAADGLVRRRPRRARLRPGQPLRRGDRTPCPPRACRSPTTGRRWSGWRRSTRPSASTSPATRSTTTPARSAASAC